MRLCLVTILLARCGTAAVEAIDVEPQPLAANVKRLMTALEFLGASPYAAEERAAIRTAIEDQDVAQLQQLLSPQVLVDIHINPESRVKVARGAAPAVLQQGGYTPILIRVHNEAAVTARLCIDSPQAGKAYAGVARLSMDRQEQPHLRENENTQGKKDRFLSVEMFTQQPLTTNLSGLELEYAIALLYSNEAGKREATLQFDVGQGTQDLGFRAAVPILFDVQPAIPIRLGIRDHDGKPTTGRLEFRDALGRVYPPQAKRLAPDLFFQRQIYRADGEHVLLPPGKFRVLFSRGPEYKLRETELVVTAKAAESQRLELHLQRWVHPMAYGFYSGDHHIHAAGCAHYMQPTVGITPEHVLPHVKGEGLNVGCILTWGPGFEHQRQFFQPTVDAVSEPLTVLKYDLEISGFGSQALGHVCLLNLANQNYPGSDGTKSKGWPSWTIPAMRWAKEQGGVTGYAHSASGLHIDAQGESARLVRRLDVNRDGRVDRQEATNRLLPRAFDKIDRNADHVLTTSELHSSLDQVANELPNYAIPAMNGVGAMEIAVASVEGVCDFISAMDTARIQEWNTWYHLLNCGRNIKVSGETDFPCMSGTRVGQGRVYVQLGKVDQVDFSTWCKALAAGRSYVSDGFAHALAFQVDGRSPGEADVTRNSPGTVQVSATVAFAPATPLGVAYGTALPPAGRNQIGDTVQLHIGPTSEMILGGKRLVEIVVNGEVAAQQIVPADGKEHKLQFEISVERSSWVSLRQFPQLHTNPVNLIVNDQPIRASKRSAWWCVEMIEKLWENRQNRIREEERDAAHAAYRRALDYYRAVAQEAP